VTYPRWATERSDATVAGEGPEPAAPAGARARIRAVRRTVRSKLILILVLIVVAVILALIVADLVATPDLEAGADLLPLLRL
jgi:hypothetical protein